MSHQHHHAAPPPAAPHHQPYVCIYASQVAMCIGANRHKKVGDALELMWQRIDPAGFRAALKRNDVKTDEELADRIIRQHSEVQQLVQLTLSAACDSSDVVAKQYDCVARDLKAVHLPEEDHRLVEDVLKRNLYTSYGNKNEQYVLDYIRANLGIRCREDPAFYKKQQGVCRGPWGSFPWYVGGKIDAIDDERTLLIEIKNRVNRLFFKVPFYEQVQVQAYLELLGLDTGVLVECLKTQARAGGGGAAGAAAGTHREPPAQAPPGAHADARAESHEGAQPTATINVIPIKRDRALWTKDIVPKLHAFVDFLARILHDTAFQDRYLSSKRRSAMITAHINVHVARR